jgi:hypothetical protein
MFIHVTRVGFCLFYGANDYVPVVTGCGVLRHASDYIHAAAVLASCLCNDCIPAAGNSVCGTFSFNSNKAVNIV